MAESEYLISDIPDLLRRLRKQRNLTLKQAAEQIGISLSYLSDIERGRTAPALETLNTIVDGYGLTLTLQTKQENGVSERYDALETQILRALEKRDWPTVFKLFLALTCSQD